MVFLMPNAAVSPLIQCVSLLSVQASKTTDTERGKFRLLISLLKRREASLTLVSNSLHRPWTGGYLANTLLQVYKSDGPLWQPRPLIHVKIKKHSVQPLCLCLGGEEAEGKERWRQERKERGKEDMKDTASFFREKLSQFNLNTILLVMQ